jgi:large subunit ribosomal protein L29
MKAPDLRKLSPEELESRVVESREILFGAQLKLSTGQLENTAQVRTARRDLARALTLRKERSGAK